LDLQVITDKQDYLQYLAELITPERYQRMIQVLGFRTRHLTVVLEDIYQPHNASAVLRSCDCFGVMDVHIIEKRNTYQVNPDVALGSSKWVNIYKYSQSDQNTSDCLLALKQKGYRIVATTPHKDDCTLQELPVEPKTALVFGNELDGLTPKALELADAYMKIPMVGFTESLNISVSAALCVSHLTERLRNSGVDWKLDEEEKTDIMIQWVKNTLKYPDRVEKEYIKRRNSRF